jgi:hypothetical protein
MGGLSEEGGAVSGIDFLFTQRQHNCFSNIQYQLL